MLYFINLNTVFSLTPLEIARKSKLLKLWVF